jgi:hypothetical protein
MNTQADLLPRLQALLAIWDEQAATAAPKPSNGLPLRKSTSRIKNDPDNY